MGRKVVLRNKHIQSGPNLVVTVAGQVQLLLDKTNQKKNIKKPFFLFFAQNGIATDLGNSLRNPL